MRALRMTAALLLLAMAGCSWRSGPKVKDVRIRVTDIDFDEVEIAIELDVYNPTDHELPAPDYAYRLFVDRDRRAFLDETGETSKRLPPKQTTTITLSVDIAYRKPIRRMRWLERAGAFPYNLRGALRVRVGDSVRSLPFAHRGSLPILRAPQFTDLQFAIPTQVSPQMQVKFHTRLTNPNAFEIDVRNLRYDISLEGDKVAGLTTESNPVIGPGQSQWVTLSVQVSAMGAMMRSGFDLKKLIKKKRRIAVRGSMKTPYGIVRLDHDH